MTPEELKELQTRLWNSADDLRANSDLRSSEYSTPVMGLIFLKFADNKYRQYEDAILEEYRQLKGTRREKQLHEIAVEKCGFYLPSKARYNYLLNLPEEEDIDQALKNAMASIEKYKPELQGVLPQDEYFKLTRTDKTIPNRLLQNFANIPDDADSDLFGQIYEYFLSNFALAEGRGGGEFFTPRSVVRLMVEIIEPHHGTVFDPACGSGGMFVQSAKFVKAHRQLQDEHEATSLYMYGQEKGLMAVKLAKMNLIVNGLQGDVRQANSYYEDPFSSLGRFDYVLTNPPFNVGGVNLQRVEDDPRFTLGIPGKKSIGAVRATDRETVPNANFLWIQMVFSALKNNGRAGIVMVNSASDARYSEQIIRQKLIESGAVDIIISVGSNFFSNVSIPCTLWFLDRGKKNSPRKDKILFIDARKIYREVTRSTRSWTQDHIQFIADIVRLYREEPVELNQHPITSDSDWDKEIVMTKLFPKGRYRDVVGLCRVAKREEIADQGWSLSPDRYIESEGLFQLNRFFQKVKYPIATLNEIVTELSINKKVTEDENLDNVIFIPMRGRDLEVTKNRNELVGNQKNYFCVHLNYEQALAPFVTYILNSKIGVMQRQLNAYGTSIPRLTKSQILQLKIPLPLIEEQLQILETINDISRSENIIQLWKNHLYNEPFEIQKVNDELSKSNNFAGELGDYNGLENWIDLLPTPLAKIAWLYVVEISTEKKLEHLLHFFEGFSQFISTFFFSILSANEDFYNKVLRTDFLKEHNNLKWFCHPTFGNWNHSNSKITELLTHHLEDKKRHTLYQIFGSNDSQIFELINPSLYGILKNASEIRNSDAHGGFKNDEIARSKLMSLEGLLESLKRISFSLPDTFKETNEKWTDGHHMR
jgi:type I restriction-modification system DNA methylase subunit